MRDHPTFHPYRSDLGKTYINLSDLELRAGRPGKAVDLLVPARDSLRQVFRARKGDRLARNALASACDNLGEGLVGLGRYTEALAAYRECADLELELLRTNDPRFPPSGALLEIGLLGLARCYRQLGRDAEAAEATEQVISHIGGNPPNPVAIASELMHCSVNAKDRAAAERSADRAIVFLQRAVASRVRDIKLIRTDPIFDPLRARADFRACAGRLGVSRGCVRTLT